MTEHDEAERMEAANRQLRAALRAMVVAIEHEYGPRAAMWIDDEYQAARALLGESSTE